MNNEALAKLGKEELAEYASILLKGALDKLSMDLPEEAAWRIANALGVVATITADSPNIVSGVGVKTSLGYKLELGDDNT